MARRSKIKTEVPAKIREEFDAELVAGGFSDYQGLTNWLNARLKAEGIDMKVSVMAANRYGKAFQENFERDMAEANQTYHIAKIAMANNEDTEGVVRDATIRTLQTRLLRLSTALRDAEEAGDDPHLLAETTAKISRAVADLSRTDILSQKYKAEIKKAAALEAANTMAKSAKDAGVSEETIKRIRMDVLGMAE
ncbi:MULTISPECIES: phage protein Gp27 family protein [Methylobacter]